MKKERIGRLLAIPVLLVVFLSNIIIGLSFGLSISYNPFDPKWNWFLLVLFALIFQFLVAKLYKRREKIFHAVYIVSIVFLQNLFITAFHRSLEVDIFNDISFVIILPTSIVMVLLWGSLYDRIKNIAS